MKKNSLILTQSRERTAYNDFIGRFYHFPKKYLSQFDTLPVEFIYYEPTKNGDGVYFGYGTIINPPIEDKREQGQYFVEIFDYKPFSEPVAVKDINGKLLEADSPHYNSQNAVRKISSELLDEICLDGKIQLNFKADAHLIKVLGEQLIGSEKVGILELIKNAYDAGSSYCRVRIENIPGILPFGQEKNLFPELPGPVIVIEDDGSGMTREVIENGWLRPASTIKTVIKENIKQEKEKAVKNGTLGAYEKLISEIKEERGGRIPLGEKGVGRFAAHRLGKRLLLKTKVKDLNYEYVLEVDWDKFDGYGDKSKDLESVGISLSRQKPSRDYGENGSGTQLVIYGGRDGFSWDSESIEDMNRSIISLNSPYPHPKAYIGKGFAAYLECPQLGDLPTDNPSKMFVPTFTFDGFVDENGILNYSLKFQPPKPVPMPEENFQEDKLDLRKADVKYWSESSEKPDLRKPECGSFFIHLGAWYRKDPWISGPDGKNFIDYLTNFGGISIFRDGINIFPAEWGAETDWLGLSKRHIKQGFRMSYYNMIGNIELDQTKNIELVDKTNREGLIANTASKDLRQLVNIIVTTIIENKFIGKRDDLDSMKGNLVRDSKALKGYADEGTALISNIKNNYPVEEDPYNILLPFGTSEERVDKLVNLSNSLKSLQESIKLMQEAQDLLTEQAGYGMAVAVSVHEIAKITANFYNGVSHLLKSDELDKEKLNDLKDASVSLQSELKRLSPLRAVKTESRTEFKIIRPIKYTLDVFRSRLEKLDIQVEINSQENFVVYGRYGGMIQILSNLFDNSCYWLSTNPDARKIKIKIDQKHRTIIFADSGPGIGESILPYLFKPGYSMKVPPSGLGLYICKYYMQNMNGDIYLTNDRERLPEMTGAQFTLDFGHIPSERIIEERK